jgi:hypothetical protein
MNPDDTSIPADSARQRGAREYFAHRGVYRNPYPLGSSDYNDYERGWMQSLKRNEGALVELASRSPVPAPQPTPASDYNAYAERKGRTGPRK